MSNILSIGKSALLAAQVAIDTTGHNIANASTAGYTRQVVVQGAVAGQNMGFGYVGKGTEIVEVSRIYSEYLTTQVRSAQTSASQLGTYYTQIQQIDNMLADPTVGLTPVMADFFSSLQDVSSNPSSITARQSLLSSAETLVSQFQSLDEQLSEINDGLNSQIEASVTSINAYAKEIASLNDAIQKALGSSTNQPNDLLDQRDQLVAELSKQVRVSVVSQGNGYDVYIGNGQPLVVGTTTYNLVTEASPTDPNRIEVGYRNNGVTTLLSSDMLSGGNLSGFLEFRSETLDVAQNSIGRIATVLASTFNEQHSLGMDLNGAIGGAFFNVADPLVTASSDNTSSTLVTASIVDPSKLTTSDYKLSWNGTDYSLTKLSDNTILSTSSSLANIVAAAGAEGFGLAVTMPTSSSNYDLSYDGTNYTLTRLSDNTVLANGSLTDAQTAATTAGITFSATNPMASGDQFLIRPTANGASDISLAISDPSEIAAAAPIVASANTANTGTGKISAGVVNTPLTLPISQVTITFTSATTYSVTGGLPATGTYTAGTDIDYNGWTVQISGAPANGDVFTIGSNASGTGDNRNVLLLGALQTSDLLAGGTATYQEAYSQLVNMIGNKTSQLEVTSTAANTSYTQAYNAQQSESGVNLDEEEANLLRYQQAYQAAAKVMQTASTLFDTLLAIGA